MRRRSGGGHGVEEPGRGPARRANARPPPPGPRSACSAAASAITEPPNPPPVIRAPSAPAAAAASTATSAPARTPRSRRAATRARRSAAGRLRRVCPARSSRAAARTRSFSVTRAGPGGAAPDRQPAELGRAVRSTSRSDRHAQRPGRRPRTARRLAAYSPSDELVPARVSITSRASPAAARSSGTAGADAAAAVQQQRVPGLAEQRGRLVHDPGRARRRSRSRPGGPSRPARAGGTASPYSSVRASADRAFQRGRGGQAGAERDVGSRWRCWPRRSGSPPRAAPRPRRPGRRPSR